MLRILYLEVYEDPVGGPPFDVIDLELDEFKSRCFYDKDFGVFVLGVPVTQDMYDKYIEWGESSGALMEYKILTLIFRDMWDAIVKPLIDIAMPCQVYFDDTTTHPGATDYDSYYMCIYESEE